MPTQPDPQTLTPNPSQASDSSSEPGPESEPDSDEESESDSDYYSDSDTGQEEDNDPLAALAMEKENEETIQLLRELARSGKTKSAVEEMEEMEEMEDEEEGKPVPVEERYDFPKDPENWREEDLREVWADRPPLMSDTGFDPVWATHQDRMLANELRKVGLDSPERDFYVPYRKPYPVTPKNDPEVAAPEGAIEELDTVEIFLLWASYIFPDGSSYEGTVWDDLAHGRGVYVDQTGLVRYEGEWLRNEMEGHGVLEVDIPDDQPIPGSWEEEEMRDAGMIVAADFMNPEDREWLKMDAEDCFALAEGRLGEGNSDRVEAAIRELSRRGFGKGDSGEGDPARVDLDRVGTGRAEISTRESGGGLFGRGLFGRRGSDGGDFVPWYERQEWVTYFGMKPEKGRYRYAGQMKHGRMHGCGQYEVNERTIYGRFYFGHLLEDPHGCEDEIAAMHAGIAEVAAAKARMFLNKPDGMVREKKGPYSDPQHPYFYEEEDVWMAPGFIHQFHEVPNIWKKYVEDLDVERQMWLDSFYKTPLTLPMPSELQYWWEQDATPEFVLMGLDPFPDPDDPTKEVIEPFILHTPSGRVIDYVMDDEHGIRLFWIPEDGVLDVNNIEFIPLTQDDVPKKETAFDRYYSAFIKKCEVLADRFENWLDERIRLQEAKVELAEKELELVEAKLLLEELLASAGEDSARTEVIGDRKESEGYGEDEAEEGGGEEGSVSSLMPVPSLDTQDENQVAKEVKDYDGADGAGYDGEDDDDEEEEDDDDDDAPSSFGSANPDQNIGKSGPSPFSALGLSLATSTLASGIPALLQRSFLSWKNSRSTPKLALPSETKCPIEFVPRVDSVTFTKLLGHQRKKLIITKSQSFTLRAQYEHSNGKVHRIRSLPALKKKKLNRDNKQELPRSQGSLTVGPENELDYVLSLHTPFDQLQQFALAKCS